MRETGVKHGSGSNGSGTNGSLNAAGNGMGGLLPAEEARLLERLWTSATNIAFPLKGRPTVAEAAELNRLLLRSRLRAEELTEPAHGELQVSVH